MLPAEEPRRGRGRPRVPVDREAVADTVARLFAEGGAEAVTVAGTAEALSMSRATLYRSVPSREDLMGILFERSTQELTDQVLEVVRANASPRRRLEQLVSLQVTAAVRMQNYLPVFFDGGDLPDDVVDRWRSWTRRYEEAWVDVVEDAMRSGDLQEADPMVTTRLLLGMCIWVSRWYRSDGPVTPESVTDAALRLLWRPST